MVDNCANSFSFHPSDVGVLFIIFSSERVNIILRAVFLRPALRSTMLSTLYAELLVVVFWTDPWPVVVRVSRGVVHPLSKSGAGASSLMLIDV